MKKRFTYLFIILFLLTGCKIYIERPLDGLLSVDEDIYIEVNTFNDDYTQFINEYSLYYEGISSVMLAYGEINPNIIGDYPISIGVYSTSEDYYEFSTTIHIQDTTPPQVTLNSTYFGQGDISDLILSALTITDNYYAYDTITKEIVFNDLVIGEGIFNIDIRIIDDSNNETLINTDITVDYDYDNESPIIIGAQNYYIPLLSDEIDLLAGISTSDIQADNVSIIIIEDIDYSVVGYYPVTYIAIDEDENTSVVETFVYIHNGGLTNFIVPQPYLLELNQDQIDRLNEFTYFVDAMYYVNDSSTYDERIFNFVNEFYTFSFFERFLNRELRTDEINLILDYQELMERNEIVYMENILSRELTDLEKGQFVLARNAYYEYVDTEMFNDCIHILQYGSSFYEAPGYISGNNIKTKLTEYDLLAYSHNPSEVLFNALKFYKQFYLDGMAYNYQSLMFGEYSEYTQSQIQEMENRNYFNYDTVGFYYENNFYAYYFKSLEEIETIIGRPLTTEELDYLNYLKWHNMYRTFSIKLECFDYEYIKNIDLDKLIEAYEIYSEFKLYLEDTSDYSFSYDQFINTNLYLEATGNSLTTSEYEALTYWNQITLENDMMYNKIYINILSKILDPTIYSHMETYFKLYEEMYYTFNSDPFRTPDFNATVRMSYEVAIIELYINRSLTQTEIDALNYINDNPILKEFIDYPVDTSIAINYYGLELLNDVFNLKEDIGLYQTIYLKSFNEVESILGISLTQEQKDLYYIYRSYNMFKALTSSTNLFDIDALDELITYTDSFKDIDETSLWTNMILNKNTPLFVLVDTSTNNEYGFTEEYLQRYLELINRSDYYKDTLYYYENNPYYFQVFQAAGFNYNDALIIDQYLYDLSLESYDSFSILNILLNYSIEDIGILYNIEIPQELEEAILKFRKVYSYKEISEYLSYYQLVSFDVLRNETTYLDYITDILTEFDCYDVLEYKDINQAMDYLTSCGLDGVELVIFEDFLESVYRLSNRTQLIDIISQLSIDNTVGGSNFNTQDIINILSIQYSFDNPIMTEPYIFITYPSTLVDETIQASIDALNEYFATYQSYRLLNELSIQTTNENMYALIYLLTQNVILSNYTEYLDKDTIDLYISISEVNPISNNILNAYFSKASYDRLILSSSVDLNSFSPEELLDIQIAAHWYYLNGLKLSDNQLLIESKLARYLNPEEQTMYDLIQTLSPINID